MGDLDGSLADGPDAVELVRRAQQRDAPAFVCLAARHQGALARFCRRLMPRPALAEDLAQETGVPGACRQALEALAEET